MMKYKPPFPLGRDTSTGTESGFSLVEFLIAAVILVALGATAFSAMAEMQRTASYQTEVQSVNQNLRIAMDTLSRYVKQAGNNPRAAAFEGITITGATQVRLRADVTGLAGGNLGDSDGDTADLDEDVTIRFNAAQRSIEMVLPNGDTRSIANYVTGFSMQYFDRLGVATGVGADVRRIRITITAGTLVAHPQTHRIYRITEASDVQVATRT
jgi:Tfp pilus assembly protein PilW